MSMRLLLWRRIATFTVSVHYTAMHESGGVVMLEGFIGIGG